MANENESNPELEGVLEPNLEQAPELSDLGQPIAPEPGKPETSRPAPDERLTKALETISRLEREVTDLRGRPQQVVYRDPVRGEQTPEMIEVLPGRRIPKDPDQRAIKLRAEDLLAMGWNEDPARALNTLANAFFHHIAEVVPAITMAHLEERSRTHTAGQSRQQAFYNEFPDLRDFGDLANIVEQQTMQEIPMQGMSQSEWNREVGGRVRQRIASMRGISLEQYTSSLGPRPSGTRTPRAVTAPPARGARTASPGEQQREMDDMMEGRL